MGYTVLTKSDEMMLMETLRDFILRVASETGVKSPEEIAILPDITQILLQCFTA